MSIISEALKKSEVGKDETGRQQEAKPAPLPKLDVPDSLSRPLLKGRSVDLLADRRFQVPAFLSRWARGTRPWMIWAGMVISLLFATVFYEWKAQGEKPRGGLAPFRGEKKVSRVTQKSDASTAPLKQENLRALKQEATLFSLKKAADFYLTGISADRGGNIAIVNNKIVREGDLVDGARVISIKPQEVILERRGERLSRTLY